MGNEYSQESTEQHTPRHAKQSGFYRSESSASEQLEVSVPILPGRVGLRGRSSEAIRQATIQRMQQNYGNRATREAVARFSNKPIQPVQRAPQRTVAHAPIAVQRDEEELWSDDETKARRDPWAGPAPNAPRGMAAEIGASLQGMKVGGHVSPIATGPLFALEGTLDPKDPTIEGLKDALSWTGDKLAKLGKAGGDVVDTAKDKIKHPVRSMKELYNWIF